MARTSASATAHSCVLGEDLMCAHVTPGHTLDVMRRRLAAATPSRFQDALVVSVSGSVAELVLLGSGTVVRVWNHEALGAVLAVGEPVALHPVYDVLAVGDDWVSIRPLG